MLLKVENLSKEFGGLRAVNEVSMEIREKELVGLIGPNGAGKTTFFNLVTGVYEPTEGKVVFDGKEIQGKKPYVITQGGMARTFQNIRLFSEVSVLDNIRTACSFRVKYSVAESIFRFGRYMAEEKAIVDESIQLLEIFGLAHKKDELAKKIIATTTDSSLVLPQPSKQFIQKYVEEYNKGREIKEVLVEYEEY